MPFLTYAKLLAPLLIEQIVELASIGQGQGRDQAGDPAALAPHLLKAATALNLCAPAELSAALESRQLARRNSAPSPPVPGNQLARLRAASWLPGTGGDGAELRLFPPCRVAHQLQLDLWPRFGRLPD